MKRATPNERFERKWVPGPNGCHIWTGYRDNAGYGQFWAGKSHKAHRWALSQATGEWPDPKVLAIHRCDTPSCVNPEHLFWGSHQDNTQDMMQKGRHKFEGQPPKLTPSQRDEIRKTYQPRKHSQNSMAKLAERYGVSKAAIHMVIHRKTKLDQENPN